MMVPSSTTTVSPRLTRRVNAALLVLLTTAAVLAQGQNTSQPTVATGTIRVDAAPGSRANSFVPAQTLGAGIDRLPNGAIDKLIDPATVTKVLSAGWQPVTYRQNTELFVEAWHWNPQGQWSDPSGKGYFTGSATPTEFIRHSYGYPLPHRGFTRNEGTGAKGYSRITDGDLSTYWKSNPYLAKPFTGEDDSLHPQWVVLDLAAPQAVNAIRITWGAPYARQYVVQYWTGTDPMHHPTTRGMAVVSVRHGERWRRRVRDVAIGVNSDCRAVRADSDDSLLEHVRHAWCG